MRINSISQIPFQKLPIKKHAGFNIVDDFVYRAQDENRTMYTVETKKFMNDSYDTNFINDDELEAAASQQYKIYPNMIFVDSMYTNSDLQHKYGFGKSMHLLNIVEMFENNADSIQLEATGEAVPFHTQMGFYPDGKWSTGVSVNVERITNDNTPELKKYTEIAKLLMNAENKMSENALSILGNKLINGYTKAALKIKPKQELKYLVYEHIPMILKREDIIRNKDYYNRLFDKYGIDYHID